MSAQAPYPQQPYAPQQAPVKKRRTWLIVLIVLLVVLLVVIAGCTALLGGAAKSVGEAVSSASASQSQEADRNAPREVTEGEAFTIGSHQTLAGWKVKQAEYDQGFVVTGKVKNVSDETSTAFLHFKFIDKSGEVIGNVQCNSADLEPDQTQKLNCIPDGEYGKYAKITAEATF